MKSLGEHRLVRNVDDITKADIQTNDVTMTKLEYPEAPPPGITSLLLLVVLAVTVVRLVKPLEMIVRIVSTTR